MQGNDKLRSLSKGLRAVLLITVKGWRAVHLITVKGAGLPFLGSLPMSAAVRLHQTHQHAHPAPGRHCLVDHDLHRSHVGDRRAVGRPMTSMGIANCRTMPRSTISRWSSFLSKTVTAGCTHWNSFVTTVHTPRARR